MANRLAQFKFGRILLHGICLFHFHGHFTWHVQGIKRELAQVNQIESYFASPDFQSWRQLARESNEKQ